ncbi:nitroreductase family protein [Sphingomonas sp. RB3P16]|uniref:Acg family FMN-binding oxidoreductase n=1 Tax=Parasphingomonas frigoris TaxID=3096163 RepID=UPI002FCA2BDB
MNRRTLLTGAGSAVAAAGIGFGAIICGEGSMADYDAAAAQSRTPLIAEPGHAPLIRAATLAANGHNAQPWRFRTEARTIAILPDFARRTPVVDPDDHHLYVSLGCAAENLVLAARASGRPGDLGSTGDGPALRYDFTLGRAEPSPLHGAITRRQSTRALYDGRAVPPGDLARLDAAGTAPEVNLVLLTERARIDPVRDLVLAGNRVQMQDQAFMRELKAWLRFNPRAALRHRDGLFSRTSGNPVLPTWLGGPAVDLLLSADAENATYAQQIPSSAGLAVFFGDRADPAHWIAVGRACQRFALTATSLGLKHAFLNQPVEVAFLRAELAKCVGAAGHRPDIVMRFGYGPDRPFSLRRPVAAVLA